MGIFSAFARRQAPVTLEDRAPQTGVKLKDMLVLKQLMDVGADLSAPRHVLYFLYFNDRANAEAAASEATASAFASKVSEPIPENPESWKVVCERHSYVLSMEAVRDNTNYFEQLAARFSGDYNGWEASVN